MGCSTGHSYSDEKQKDSKKNEHKITIDGLGKNIYNMSKSLTINCAFVPTNILK